MSVRPLPNGNWIADRTIGRKPGGAPDRRTKTVATEKEARYWDQKFEYEQSLAHGSVPTLITLSDYVDAVFWDKKENLRQDTRSVYSRVLRSSVLPVLGQMSVGAIAPIHVQDMINGCSTEKAGRQAREVLSSVLSLALDGTGKANPASSRHFVYPPPNPRAGERKGVILSTYEQHAKLVNHVRRHHEGELIERLVVVALGMGLRPEEVLGLDWEAFDQRSMTAEIYQVYNPEGGLHLDRVKTPKARRTLPIGATVREGLASWSRGAGKHKNLYGEPCHPLMLNTKGGRSSHYTARQAFARLRAERYDDGEKVPGITLWSLRHSYGTAAIVDGHMDVNLLCELMGHEDPSTTRKLYVKPQFHDLRNAVSALDAIYAKLA